MRNWEAFTAQESTAARQGLCAVTEDQQPRSTVWEIQGSTVECGPRSRQNGEFHHHRHMPLTLHQLPTTPPLPPLTPPPRPTPPHVMQTREEVKETIKKATKKHNRDTAPLEKKPNQPQRTPPTRNYTQHTTAYLPLPRRSYTHTRVRDTATAPDQRRN